jgi:hypothetical protein
MSSARRAILPECLDIPAVVELLDDRTVSEAPGRGSEEAVPLQCPSVAHPERKRVGCCGRRWPHRQPSSPSAGDQPNSAEHWKLYRSQQRARVASVRNTSWTGVEVHLDFPDVVGRAHAVPFHQQE